MSLFKVTSNPIDLAAFRQNMLDETCGAYVQFDGWVRNHNEGQQVLRLEYELSLIHI